VKAKTGLIPAEPVHVSSRGPLISLDKKIAVQNIQIRSAHIYYLYRERAIAKHCCDPHGCGVAGQRMEQLPIFAPPKVSSIGDEEVGYFRLNTFIHDLIIDPLAPISR
jgi:hypothetical protein